MHSFSDIPENCLYKHACYCTIEKESVNITFWDPPTKTTQHRRPLLTMVHISNTHDFATTTVTINIIDRHPVKQFSHSLSLLHTYTKQWSLFKCFCVRITCYWITLIKEASVQTDFSTRILHWHLILFHY